jgi:hypothetical protein
MLHAFVEGAFSVVNGEVQIPDRPGWALLREDVLMRYTRQI